MFTVRAVIVTACVCVATIAGAQDLPSEPVSLAGGRVTIGTDLSFTATAQDDTDGAWFNYTDYEYNALRMLRLSVNAEVRISDRISVLTDVRSENGHSAEPYALYVRVRPWRDRAFDIQAGRIPPTFGAFPRREYSAGNPLIGYPLAYQYLTSVRADAVPATPEDVLRMRARGWRPSYPIGSNAITPGLPLISALQWDTGVQVHAEARQFSGTFAITNGTMSDPRVRDNNGGKELSGRVQWQPDMSFALGASAARGAYVDDGTLAAASLLESAAGGSAQRAFGFDAEYSRDHWLVRGELIWNQWQVPTLSEHLVASNMFIESRYKVLPGMYVAGRVDRLGFSTLRSAQQPRTWDAPVTRVETGLGYYLRRNLLAKLAYQYNWRDGGLVRRRGLLATQLHFWL